VCFQMEVEDRRRAYGEEHEDKAEPSALSDALIEAFCILDRAPVAANLWTPHPPLGTSFPLAAPGLFSKDVPLGRRARPTCAARCSCGGPSGSPRQAPEGVPCVLARETMQLGYCVSST
jgi:hypothetical protein